MIYFVATPIGNLKDISYRAVETLKSVDVIACEDTRNSMKLLNHYDIHKKTIAYHKFNEISSSDGIIKLANEGNNIAIISDAGMPVISDPGSILIKKLKENKIDFTVIPGANAGLCALLLSGMDCSKFTFVGFLPEQNKDKKILINQIKNIPTTLVFYVSPHGLKDTLKYLSENLGTRKCCLVSEISKLYEKTYELVLGEEFNFEIKGEYVLIVEANKNDKQFDENISVEQELQILLDDGIAKNEAIKIVATKRGMKKNDVYQIALKL